MIKTSMLVLALCLVIPFAARMGGMRQGEKIVDLGCCITGIVARRTPLLGENTAAHANNGFVLTLNSDRHVYSTTDAINIWAALEYTGSRRGTKIWHDCPFMIFSISGGDGIWFGGIFFGFRFHCQATSVLERGRVYHFDYQKGGIMFPEDPGIEYWNHFFDEGELLLPPGEYTITVLGNFYLSDWVDWADRDKSGLMAEITIVVTP